MERPVGGKVEAQLFRAARRLRSLRSRVGELRRAIEALREKTADALPRRTFLIFTVQEVHPQANHDTA